MKTKRILIVFVSSVLGVCLIPLWLFMVTSPILGVRAAPSATHTVCHSSCDFSILQDAVDAAGEGDIIKVAAGTYNDIHTRNGVTQIVYLDKSVSILGGYDVSFTELPNPDLNPTILDAEGNGRVIYVTGDISPTIAGFEITNGDANGLDGGLPPVSGAHGGGGIYVISATATIENNKIYQNTGWDGAGLYLQNSAAVISSNLVFSNTAEGDGYDGEGGGILLWECNATLADNTINSNLAGWGGGLSLEFDSSLLSGNEIKNNQASYRGGGIHTYPSGTVIMQNDILSNTVNQRGGGIHMGGGEALISGNLVKNNTSHEDGGGIYFRNSDITLSANQIISNTANNWGGGVSIFNGNSGVITVSANIITANHIEYEGGGLFILCDFCDGGNLIGNTITSNTASYKGGGIYLATEQAFTSTNDIIAENSAGQSSGIHVLGEMNMLHGTIANNTGGDGIGIYVGWLTTTLTNTIIADHTVGVFAATATSANLDSTLWYGNGTNWDGTGSVTHTNDYFGDPVFVNPTSGDYHIAETSAAIDQAINAGVLTDIDGETRPNGNGFDIGADEYYEKLYIYLPLIMK